MIPSTRCSPGSVRTPSAKASHLLGTSRHASFRPRLVTCQSSSAPVKDRVFEQPLTQQRRRTAPSDLNDPAQIGAKAQACTQVPAFGGPVSLQSYMTLPVEQYFVLDPKQIRHLGGNRFLLLVPRINIFNVWLEPEVEIIVTTITAADGTQKVVLQAENCRIKGSQMIENLRLDQRFCMRFTTELTWDDGLSPATATGSRGSLDEEAIANGALSIGSISGDAVLDVWCEVITPFNLMPRSALQSTCNAVMRGLVNTLLPMFLRNLGTDYGKWAVEPEYRAERAQRSNPIA